MEHHLSYEEQLLFFKERGMQGIEPDTADFEKQLNTLKIIGYYKLKQYSYTFWNRKSLKYEEIQFNDLVKRYYRDQQLKQEIFQAIGDIETALNNEISYILGKKDPYLYLDFKHGVKVKGEINI
ncbi:Abi family protein [Lactobacillus amylovorus]|uniref:Abi family protein n=1 Tax=Lactobacillus amylovorus TaxID=1604 RepID=UPI00232BBC67|nr:Abi family protein [Lactobacillus amylovorus]MDB6245346.1 Abi family protein [Lactobacillus amylovorus]MDB6249300.1 Abi family protein [Lactobacillus amylovorus]MDB6270559.1 Abi family protein [Lactobacillus amylovorus]